MCDATRQWHVSTIYCLQPSAFSLLPLALQILLARFVADVVELVNGLEILKPQVVGVDGDHVGELIEVAEGGEVGAVAVSVHPEGVYVFVLARFFEHQERSDASGAVFVEQRLNGLIVVDAAVNVVGAVDHLRCEDEGHGGGSHDVLNQVGVVSLVNGRQGVHVERATVEARLQRVEVVVRHVFQQHLLDGLRADKSALVIFAGACQMEQLVHVFVFDDLLDFEGRVAGGVHHAHDGPHGGSYNAVGLDVGLVHGLQKSEVGVTERGTTRQREAYFLRLYTQGAA